MAKKVHKSYKRLDCCANCDKAFVYKNYSELILYCTHYAPSRPKCGSSLLDGEEFEVPERMQGETSRQYLNRRFKMIDPQSRKWDSWSRYRAVDPYGKCDMWVKKQAEKEAWVLYF